MAFLGMAMIIDSRGIDEFFDTRVKISGLDESPWHVTLVQILLTTHPSLIQTQFTGCIRIKTRPAPYM
ncbi:MAG: hypothetical protein CL987_05470 [Euryarchaeota archaeon]|nr:hypothetical protein [Euryarchaeota archaeon]|tara:strand:+ start:430 stop:633 length:204 start_codon:yes stop_codon:yes gene_type:complete